LSLLHITEQHVSKLFVDVNEKNTKRFDILQLFAYHQSPELLEEGFERFDSDETVGNAGPATVKD
jgi:hypothetical protein